jgi:hypothetical protein
VKNLGENPGWEMGLGNGGENNPKKRGKRVKKTLEISACFVKQNKTPWKNKKISL